MTEASSANLEMAIVLPLGVVVSQLMRIEADLRLLNMKAFDLGKERENEGLTGLIEARLENINEALNSIGALVSDIESDIHSGSIDVARTSTKDHTSQHGTRRPTDGTPSSPDGVYSHYSNSKPHPDRDD